MRVTPVYVIRQLILREGQLKKADKELESNLMAAQALPTQHNLLPAPAPTTLNVEVNNNDNRRPQRQYISKRREQQWKTTQTATT